MSSDDIKLVLDGFYTVNSDLPLFVFKRISTQETQRGRGTEHHATASVDREKTPQPENRTFRSMAENHPELRKTGIEYQQGLHLQRHPANHMTAHTPD